MHSKVSEGSHSGVRSDEQGRTASCLCLRHRGDADIHDHGVHEGQVVAVLSLARILEAKTVLQGGQRRLGAPVEQELVQVITEVGGLEGRGEVGEDGWDRAHLGNIFVLEIAEVRIGEVDGRREGAEDYVAELDAGGGYSITESEVVFAEEFGEVVEEDQEKAEGTTIEIARALSQVGILQERRKELEQGQQQLVEGRPSLRNKNRSQFCFRGR